MSPSTALEIRVTDSVETSLMSYVLAFGDNFRVMSRREMFSTENVAWEKNRGGTFNLTGKNESLVVRESDCVESSYFCSISLANMKRQRKHLLLDVCNEELKSQLQGLVQVMTGEIPERFIIYADSDSLTLGSGQLVLVDMIYKVHDVWFLRGELQ